MAYTHGNYFPVDLVPEPYRDLCLASYHLGRSTARSLREVWNDPEFYGEGYTAGLFFKISEFFYDLEQRSAKEE